MSNISETISSIGMLLKSLSGLVVFGFLVYSMYFMGHYDLGVIKGVLAFIFLLLFTGFVAMIPFGTTFAPILFEWWWHDIPFWDFSTGAWAVTTVSMVANCIIAAGILLSRDENT